MGVRLEQKSLTLNDLEGKFTVCCMSEKRVL